MHHLDEMPRAALAAVQIALLGGAANLLTPRGARRGSHARGQRGKEGVEPLDRLLVAANHQAVAALQSPDAAAGADIEIVHPLRLQGSSAPDILTIEGV